MRHGDADRTLLAISFAVVSAVTLALIYRDNCVTHSGAWALIVGPVVAGVLAYPVRRRSNSPPAEERLALHARRFQLP